VILSTNSTFALMGLRKTLHLADKMPKAFSIVRLAREGLKLKTRWGSSRFFPGNGFINQGLRGKMSSPRNTYVRFWPSTGTGLGRFNLVGTSSNAVPYKVSDRTLASSMLPYASISKNVKQYLASHTACKTILYMKTFIVKIGRADLFRAFNVCVLPLQLHRRSVGNSIVSNSSAILIQPCVSVGGIEYFLLSACQIASIVSLRMFDTVALPVQKQNECDC